MAFLNRFFPCEIMNSKVDDFMNLGQGFILVKEYCLKFTQLANYALKLPNSRAHISKFVSKVSD